MKNILLKISTGLIALFIFIGSNAFVRAQGFMEYGYGRNGFDFGNIINHYAFGAGILFMVLFLICLAFWIWMLVHAINHKINYKPVWILVLWFMNIIGAIVYYFAVKKNCPCCQNNGESQVCVCDPNTGICTCGAVSKHTLNKVDKEMDENDAKS